MSSRSQAKAFRQAGLPLLLLVGGGFYGLSYILQGNRSVKVHFVICVSHSVLSEKDMERSLCLTSGSI